MNTATTVCRLGLFIGTGLCMAIGILAGPLEEGVKAHESGRYYDAFKNLMPAAKAGEARAQFLVGKMYEQGQGVSRDYQEAAKWYEQAAAQNNPDAQFSLGVMFEYGMGVERSNRRAADLYQAAATAGHAEAAESLAFMVKRGLAKQASPPQPPSPPPQPPSPPEIDPPNVQPGTLPNSDDTGIFQASDPSEDPVIEDLNIAESNEAPVDIHRTSGILSPALELPSGSPPVNLQPHRELSIAAPANALDMARTFTADPISGDEFDHFSEQMVPNGIVPLAAYHIEAGMQENDRWPGEATFSFDLNALGLAPEAHKDARVIRIDDQQMCFLLESRLVNGKLQVERRTTSIYMAVLVGVAAGTAFHELIVQYDKKAGSKSYNTTTLSNFILHVPTEFIKPAYAQEKQRINAELRQLYDVTVVHASQQKPGGMTARDRAYSPIELANNFCKIPRVMELQAELKTIETVAWLRANAWPDEIAEIADGLERAYSYLIETRKFRSPGYLIEVYVQSPWVQSQETYAYANKKYLHSPWIELNYDLLVKNRATDPGTAKATMECTIVHELFHIVQYQYSSSLSKWFAEATACLAELEANTCFKAQDPHKADADTVTHNRMGHFKESLNTETLEQGYANTHFLKYLRDFYYEANGDDFLPKLMNESTRWFSTPVKALYKATSNNEKSFETDYLSFAWINADKISSEQLVSPSTSLTPDAPYLRWPLVPAPLSSPCCDVLFRQCDPAQTAEGWLIIKPNDLTRYDIYTRLRVGDKGRPWINLETKNKYGRIKLADCKVIDEGFTMQRIEPYIEVPKNLQADIDASAQPLATEIFLALPPKSPTLKMEDKNLIIEWDPTSLAKAQDKEMNADANGKPAIRYRITLRLPSGKVFEGNIFKTRLTLDMEELGLKFDADGKLITDPNDKGVLQVWLQDLIGEKPQLIGPKSKPAGLEDLRQKTLEECDKWAAASSGGHGGTVDTWDISKLPDGAAFDIKFNAMDIPDKYIVQYEGKTVLDTGWRGSQSYVDQNPNLYPGGLSGPGSGDKSDLFVKGKQQSFVVRVYGPGEGTCWDYSIRARCAQTPQKGGGTTDNSILQPAPATGP